MRSGNAGRGGGDASSGGKGNDEDSAILGKVVDIYTQLPVVGVLVSVAGESVTTDDSGSFRIPKAGMTYNISVTEGNASQSIYMGLASKTPVLGH
ncbi:MAG: hypothetical protein ABI560_11790, partial [Myxococcales bacterium]